MIAATTMMWMAESLGYDTGPREGFDEVQVRQVLGIPERVRVIFLLTVGRLTGDDGHYPADCRRPEPSSKTDTASRRAFERKPSCPILFNRGRVRSCR
jgi:nitroreductase